MTAYDDLFVRDTWSDNGNYPVTDEYVSASPDVLPLGTLQLTSAYIASMYSNTALSGTQIIANNFNYIYVRAKNASTTTPRPGQLVLRWAPANLLVQPSVWKSNVIKDQDTLPYASLPQTAPGQVVAPAQPLVFTTTPSMPQHFCFIATITNSHGDPTPTQDFPSWQAFVDWVRNNPNVAWHNVDVVTTLPAQGYLATLAFENASPSPQMFGFVCDYSGIPSGSLLRIWAPPNSAQNFYGFDTGQVSVEGTGNKTIGGVFPAAYATTVFTSCQFPGNPTTPPSGASVTTRSNGWMPSLAGYEWYEPFSVPSKDFDLDPREFGEPAVGYFVPITTFTSVMPPSS